MRKEEEGVPTKSAVPDLGQIVANPRVMEIVQPLIEELAAVDLGGRGHLRGMG